jgi:hypothetical protein
MGCNTCKGKVKPTFEETLKEYKEEKKSSGFKVIEYTSKFIVFLFVSTILTPIIIPVLIIVLFKTLVLSHNVDIMPLLLHIGKKIFKEKDDGYDEDDEEEDVDEFDQDEYEELNKNDIVVLNNNN